MVDRCSVDVKRAAPSLGQRLDLRREPQLIAFPVVVERLLAYPVTHQVQNAPIVFPEREGEHAHHALEGPIDAPPGTRREQHLRIGRAAELRPMALQVRS